KSRRERRGRLRQAGRPGVYGRIQEEVRVLVVGGGGREHALCWALRRDAASAFADDLTLFAAPGNPGTAALATNLPVSATAVAEVVAAVLRHEIDVTIVG